ncbi:nitroreductase family deazaflavin-dependent oxidoreductase [Mycobacterium sp. E787]|uniref:nitroreductase family deazaflavin-dependent oxidoreductase n=1 Tax=Mycobacterium sp. E787 TaxID=1834150 RepID=UPI000B2D4D2F|nr:nitroreductase family deazaflavin-dependent oxidoreductase [Mycobacterium sp. E787]
MGKRLAGLLLVLAVLGWLVVLPRIIRRNRGILFNRGWFRTFLTTYNGMTRKISGTKRSSWGLLTHVGRRSGRVYQTSLGTAAYGDGFLLPLGYGRQTDWYRNLMSAGIGTLAWKGRTYALERPELISGPEAMRAWPLVSRMLLRLSGIHEFVWLHHSQAAEPLASSAQHATQ